MLYGAHKLRAAELHIESGSRYCTESDIIVTRQYRRSLPLFFPPLPLVYALSLFLLTVRERTYASNARVARGVKRIKARVCAARTTRALVCVRVRASCGRAHTQRTYVRMRGHKHGPLYTRKSRIVVVVVVVIYPGTSRGGGEVHCLLELRAACRAGHHACVRTRLARVCVSVRVPRVHLCRS